MTRDPGIVRNRTKIAAAVRNAFLVVKNSEAINPAVSLRGATQGTLACQ